MDKKTAQTLIENTFNNAFSEEQFIRFSQELLNDIDFSHSRNWSTLIYEDFADKISKYKRVGLYTDPEGNEVEVLIVEVENAQMLERARTSLRNFVIKWLQSDKNKSKSRDYGLVAFYAKDDNGNDWRFSFIKVEQTSFMDEAKGKVKLKKEFTPAKRYSFLVGKYEKAYTAKNQLLPLLQNIANNPTVEELENAFSIEKVTGEFFNQYKDLYVKLYEHFENDKQVKAELKTAGIDNARFTKKLLGQIVFLYFLQKKGWLGVAQNERWGTGSRRFVQELFETAQTKKLNFFKDKLQYLFYEALAKQRDNENAYYKRFDCRIPFLNGGLFEGDITQISIPENLFRNEEKNKAGDVGTGILDVFDRYNFTIKEDEPLDKEVAVDPEMLGKVFENMLDIVERKSKGAFYTPREIVHYMCQESLIHYLDNALNSGTSSFQELGSNQTKLFSDSKTKKGQAKIEIEHTDNIKVPKKDLETFIREGHFALENDERVAAKGETRTYQYQLPESIRQHADLIDKKLSDIKICDPAIGSGAFPVGLLHELMNAMLVLKPHLTYDYLTEKLKGFGFEHRESVSDSRYIYRLKRHIIQESIYGVDIDASAIDIARLRLWLSLVVDEDDLDPIETLPNLDYKIVCGNSLIGFPDGWNSPNFQKIETLKNEFYNETDETRKKELKHQIEEQIKDRLGSSKRVFGYDVNFDFKLFFSEVWHKKGGFDVVIGNPPYIQLQKMGKETDIMQDAGFHTFARTGDIYCLFYEKGWQLLKPKGVLSYITSNKWMRAGYGENTRKFFVEKTNPVLLIDFAGQKIFETATVDVNILMFTRDKNQQKTQACIVKDNVLNELSVFVRQQANICSFNNSDSWVILSDIEQRIKEKIEKIGTPLKDWDIQINYGIKTGFNEAFIIDGTKRKELIVQDPKSDEIIRPILRGRDIKRYGYDFADLWLINTHNGIKEKGIKPVNINDYPAIKKHLDSFWKDIEKRADQGITPYNLRNCAYMDDFYKQKIVWGNLNLKASYAIAPEGVFVNAPCPIIVPANKYLLAVLNSKLADYYIRSLGVTRNGGYFEYKPMFIEQLPVPTISEKEQTKVESLVKEVPTSKTERLIDEAIYQLYNLTSEEINFIEHL